MISFIVIGKNEGWKLIRCFESVFKTIAYHEIKNFEVIYVDSKSTDDSITVAKKCGDIKIILLTGDCNAAIARNVGVKESKGDILFFIDGDMELVPEYFNSVYDDKSGIFFPFVSGNYQNYYYDKNWKFLDEDNGEYSLDIDFFTFTTGGLFLIERVLWDKVQGMNNRFKKSQDTDFALRLAKIGYLLFRKREIIAIHHTIPYLSENRKWADFFYNLYARSFLYRNNFFNKYTWKRIMRSETSIFILLSSVFSVAVHQILVVSLSGYILYIFIKALRKKKDYLSNFLYFVLRDILVIIGFLFFYPREGNELYEVIKSK